MLRNTISPYDEMVAYETLWGMHSESLKSIAELFQSNPALPSELLRRHESEMLRDASDIRAEVEKFISNFLGAFSVSVHGCFQYPTKLRDAKHPLELFYYRGDIGLIERKCISVVGARKASPDGVRRAARLARGLAERGFTIVSGLAAGVDTAAMTAALEAGGSTIGVIGTPINETYPKENRALQEQVAQSHLLISQVPFYRYRNEPFDARRRYFPERNVTMAALSEATVIVEASDTSGTLTQARACLQQGRKLFILNSCFENPSIKWPHTYEKRGAIRVRDLDDVLAVVKSAPDGVQVEEDRSLGESSGPPADGR